MRTREGFRKWEALLVLRATTGVRSKRDVILGTHNGKRKSHWTLEVQKESSDVEKCFKAMSDAMCPLPNQKKPVQSEGLHSVALERHYSVPEVAELWGVSEKTVRRLFDQEDGVLRWGSAETARKRGYQNLRIPQSILIRVHHRQKIA